MSRQLASTHKPNMIEHHLFITTVNANRWRPKRQTFMFQLARAHVGKFRTVQDFEKSQNSLYYDNATKKDYLSLHFLILVSLPMILTARPCYYPPVVACYARENFITATNFVKALTRTQRTGHGNRKFVTAL